MVKMAPLFDFVHRLEGFEIFAFWFTVLIIYFLVGFWTDSLMKPNSFGPYWNGLLAFAGAFLGLYVRYNYLMGITWLRYDPYLTFGLIFGSMSLFLLFLSHLRSRLA
jgi:hypothetical protein